MPDKKSREWLLGFDDARAIRQSQHRIGMHLSGALDDDPGEILGAFASFRLTKQDLTGIEDRDDYEDGFFNGLNAR